MSVCNILLLYVPLLLYIGRASLKAAVDSIDKAVISSKNAASHFRYVYSMYIVLYVYCTICLVLSNTVVTIIV